MFKLKIEFAFFIAFKKFYKDKILNISVFCLKMHAFLIY